MSERLTSTFCKCTEDGRAALICFVTAGDGDTLANLDALVAGGADIIELGMPFTDPMADGAAIQEANIRSLGKGTKTADVFAIARQFRSRHAHVPLVLMGYANPMAVRGSDWFAEQCAASGVDGVICVDAPPEEDPTLGPALRAAGIDSIRLATPTSDEKRLPVILNGASGFLYYVSVAGITGKQQASQDSISTAVAQLKQATDLPVVVGFGVKTPEQAMAIGEVADGVVVGSAIVALVGEHGSEAPAHIARYVGKLASALNRNSKEISA